MRTSLKWLLYLIYIAVITTLFLYLQFPSQAVHDYLTHRLNRIHADLNVTIGPVKPAFPPALLLADVKVEYQKEQVFEALDVEISPQLKTLWKDAKTYLYDGRAYGGALRGQFILEPIPNQPQSNDEPPVLRFVEGETQLSGLQISALDILRQAPAEYKMEGLLEGKIVFKNGPDATNQGVRARLKATDAAINIAHPLLKLGEIKADRIEIGLTMDNRILTLSQFNLNGKQLDGKLSGQISLQQPLPKSVLNLNGSVKPHRIFLADLKNKLPVNILPPKLFDEKGFAFQLDGAIDKPNFSLR